MAPLAGANTFSHKAWRQCRMCEKFMLEFTSTQLTAVSNKFHSECFFVAEADLASTELNNLNLRQFSINNDFSICVLGSRLYVVTFSAVNSIRPSSSQILENEDQNTRTNVASSPTKKKRKRKTIALPLLLFLKRTFLSLPLVISTYNGQSIRNMCKNTCMSK